MAAQRMAAREGSDAKADGSLSVESFCAKAPALRTGIPQPSLTLFRCLDLAATRRQTITALHCSFLSFSENINIPLLVFSRAKKSEVEESNRGSPTCDVGGVSLLILRMEPLS